MPYIADCSFRPTHTAGLIFSPAAIADDGQAELRVHFKPLAYLPPEPDVGAGADFNAKIIRVEIRDIQAGAWHRLDPRDTATALAFLEGHFSRAMWAEAEIETAAYFGADDESYQAAA